MMMGLYQQTYLVCIISDLVLSVLFSAITIQ